MNHDETRTRDLTADAIQTHYDQYYRLGTYPLAYYEPAYLYGASLVRRGIDPDALWDDIAPQAREEWENDDANSPWDEVVEAVRFGWERLKDQFTDDDDHQR